MMHPELFETQIVDMQLSTEKLTKGRMILAEDEAKKNCTLKIPVIRDADEFRRNLYDTWMNVKIETVKERGEVQLLYQHTMKNRQLKG